MANIDYIEISGPVSLAELVAAIDPAAAAPTGNAITLDRGRDVYATAQYDAVDADTWPYLVSIESRTDDALPVRDEAARVIASAQAAGWKFRMTSDADDALRIESTVVP